MAFCGYLICVAPEIYDVVKKVAIHSLPLLQNTLGLRSLGSMLHKSVVVYASSNHQSGSGGRRMRKYKIILGYIWSSRSDWDT